MARRHRFHFVQHPQVVRVVNDEQPARVTLQPLPHRRDDDRAVLLVRCNTLKLEVRRGDGAEGGLEGGLLVRVHPQHAPRVLLAVQARKLLDEGGLADAPEPAEDLADDLDFELW